MITGYEIHSVNNEKVLFLYLNYDSEFGLDFRNHHKHSTMKEEIKKFLEEKKIHFDGEKIALSFGGIVLAVLLITQNPTATDDDLTFTYVSDHIILNDVVEVVTPPSSSEDIIEDSNQGVETDNIIIDTSQDEVSTNSSSTNVNTNTNHSNSSSSTNTSHDSNQNANTSIPSNGSSSDNSTNSNQQEEIEQPIVNEKQVTIYRTNGQVITLSLEEYLIGVVGAEMPASFPVEALKAQAVVARTYALKKIETGGKLTDSVSTQSYKDNAQLKEMWGSSYDTYYQKIKSAVESTEGLAIYYQGEFIDAVYHSTSNGKTQDAVYVWGNSIPYLKSVDSSWDKDASSYLREVSKDFNNVLSLLGVDVNGDTSFEILSRDSSGRVLEIRVGNQNFSGVEFRTLLGLRSADFDLTLDDGNLIITTRGFGHGVGLSQYGASGMAKAGYNYKQILNHYYTGVSIY